MATIGAGRMVALLPYVGINHGSIATNTLIMDADGEEIAFKYVPQSTSPITDIDILVDTVGDPTGINLRIRVESDNADAPSGTILGATNSAVSASFTIAADGFTGLKALGESTGNLTVNVPVWIILYRFDGASLSGTNYFAFRGTASTASSAFTRVRLYTGGNWSTTPQSGRLCYVLKHADGNYDGMPYTGSVAAPTAATDIFGTYRHGVRIKSGSQLLIPGILWFATKTGSPNPLVVAVFEGSVLKYSNVVPAASIVHNFWMPIYFSSPVLLAADTYIYVILGQEDDLANGLLGDDGGDNSNDYDSKVQPMSSTYREASLATDMAFVYGDGDDPTALTVSDTDFPLIIPLIADPATDLDQAAAGGGGMQSGVMRGMAGMLR